MRKFTALLLLCLTVCMPSLSATVVCENGSVFAFGESISAKVAETQTQTEYDLLLASVWYEAVYEKGTVVPVTETLPRKTVSAWTREYCVYIPEKEYPADAGICVSLPSRTDNGFWFSGIRYRPATGKVSAVNTAVFPLKTTTAVPVAASGYVHFVESFDGSMQRVWVNGTLAFEAEYKDTGVQLLGKDLPLKLTVGGDASVGTPASEVTDVYAAYGIRVYSLRVCTQAATSDSVTRLWHEHLRVYDPDNPELETETETDTETETETEPATEPFRDENHLTLFYEGVSCCTVVRPFAASERAKEAAFSLQSAFQARLGVSLPQATDASAVPEGRVKILVGRCNDPLSRALLSTLGSNEFGISVTDTAIVITAEDDVSLEKGVAYFIEHYLTEEYLTVHPKTDMKIAKDISFHSDGSAYNLETVLPQSSTFTSYATPILQLFAPNANVPTLQGGCSDGTYHYALFMKSETDETKNKTYIVKTDLLTGKTVKTSENLSLCHGNDITYNSKTGELLVALSIPSRNKIAIVDPDTLTVKKTVTIPYEIYSIDYNAGRDKYVVGIKGSKYFRILNSDFSKSSGQYSHASRFSDCTSQGCAADDDYIYFVYYQTNCIAVYDWRGTYVATVDLPDLSSKEEPEHIFILGDTIYIGVGTYNSSYRGRVYVITPQAK